MMSLVDYRRMTDPQCASQVVQMMSDLYREDPAAVAPDPSHFPRTIAFFLAHPDHGQIQLFFECEALVGYAILVPLWSNECGGRVVLVDELFVAAPHRGRGVARGFLEKAKRDKPFGAVALVLEVTPGNGRARKLYEAVGFQGRTNQVMCLSLEAADH